MILASINPEEAVLRYESATAFREGAAPVVRSIAQFAAAEIRHYTGPYAGMRFDPSRQPFAGLYLNTLSNAHASRCWDTFATTGPRQTGKSFLGYVIPALYHLFEIGETVILAAPTLDMCADKWREDLLPAIEATRYKDLLPRQGPGSRGSRPTAIRFRNGRTLRFMTAGGSKGRVGFTSRVLIVTEADLFDDSVEDSAAPDKFSEMLHCTDAFRSSRVVYIECTVTIAKGLIWRTYEQGTASRIARPCPHCHAWVTPEREHLVGWKDAETEMQARRDAAFACPACAKPWTDAERKAANADMRLIHRGQEIDDAGKIVGEPPETRTLGFRWSAVDNHFAAAADLGAEEWKAARSRGREDAEKEQRQFVWCLPYEPPDLDLTPLDPNEVADRKSGCKKGIIPDGATQVTVGVDTGKRELNWVAMAHRPDGGAAIIDYGLHPVESDRRGVTAALIRALEELHSYLDRGWTTQSGAQMKPSQVWIDSGYHEHTTAVYQFCETVNRQLGFSRGGGRYRPTKGYGEGQQRMSRYTAPRTKSADIRYIGQELHYSWICHAGVFLVHINSDYWKSVLHNGLAVPAGEPNSIVLYDGATKHEHDDFSMEVTAEVQKEKWIDGKGAAIVWERVRRANHKLDAGYSALAAGSVTENARSRRGPGERPTAAQLAGRGA